jgi:hypothetical protein
MINRMIRASQAEISLYEEVEANPALTNEAITVVGVVAGVGAVGAMIVSLISGSGIGGALGAGIGQLIMALAGYFIWAYIAFFVGTRVFNGTADYGELLRTLGYAQAPNVLSFIPCVGFIAALWSLYLSIVAIRQALDFDTTKALLTTLVGFLAYLALFVVIGIITGTAAGIGSVLTGGQ